MRIRIFSESRENVYGKFHPLTESFQSDIISAKCSWFDSVQSGGDGTFYVRETFWCTRV